MNPNQVIYFVFIALYLKFVQIFAYAVGRIVDEHCWELLPNNVVSCLCDLVIQGFLRAGIVIGNDQSRKSAFAHQMR